MMIGPKRVYERVQNIVFEVDVNDLPEEDQEFYEGSPVKFKEYVQKNQQQQQQQQKEEQQVVQEQRKQEEQQPIIKPVEVVKQKSPQELKIEKYTKIAEEGIKEALKFVDPSKLWVKSDNSKGIQAYKMDKEPYDGGYLCTMGKGDVTTTREIIGEILNNMETKELNKKFNNMLSEIQLIEKLNDTMKLFVTVSSPPLMTNRATKQMIYYKKEGDTEYYYCQCVEFPEGTQMTVNLKKVLWSDIKFNLWIVKPHSDSSKLDVQLLSCFHPGGEMPGWLMNKVKGGRGVEQIKFLREATEKLMKKKKK